MKNQPIRVLIILGLVASLGIIAVQVHWFREAFEQEKMVKELAVHESLRAVAKSISDFNESMLPSADPVVQKSSNFFVVNINDAIDASLLEDLLLLNFSQNEVDTDFKYGIYDCQSELMVYSGNLNAFGVKGDSHKSSDPPNFQNDNYYFTVFFPSWKSTLISSMVIWWFSTGVLLIVLVFFAFGLFLVLKQKRLSEVHTDFVNNLTHEMKTPLSGMLLAVENLEGKGGQELKDSLAFKVLKEEGERLQATIGAVLESARGADPSLVMNMEKLETNELISDVVKVWEGRGKKIVWTSSITAYILGDRFHFKRMLDSLIDNAFKHGKTPVSISEKIEGGNWVLLVQDRGSGIPKKDINRVFKRFYRVSHGNLYKETGFGLGLHYVRSIIRRHRASLKLACPPEGGTIVTLKFRTL